MTAGDVALDEWRTPNTRRRLSKMPIQASEPKRNCQILREKVANVNGA
jgi:hypothetical protein